MIRFTLFGREIIFEVFQPMWSLFTNVTDRRTDGRTTCNRRTARLRYSASCGNKKIVQKEIAENNAETSIGLMDT